LAQYHEELTQAGARVVAISVDDRHKNAAMVEKLRLPFPLLSDPDGAKAIKPYGVWHDGKTFARPAVVIVGPDGEEAFRQVGGEFSDRLSEPELVDTVRGLDQGKNYSLISTTQARPQTEEPQPSEGDFPLQAFSPYFKGVRFAMVALAARAPDTLEQTETLREEAERYLEGYQALQS
jgi:hypothetical protein